MPYDGSNFGGTGSRSTSWADYQYQLAHQGNWGRNTGQLGTEMILGGPVGWYEAASGKSLLGGSSPWAGTTLNSGMTEDLYNSISPEEWASFAKMSDGEQADFLAAKRREVDAYGKNKAIQDAAAAKKQQWTDEQMGKLQKFADEMGMGVDELLAKGDIGINKVGDSAANAAGRDAYSRGLGGGGISQLNTQRAMGDAMQNYVFQRQQAGNAARQNLMSFVENNNRYDQGIDLQLQQARGAAQQQAYNLALQQSGGTMGLIGGAIGAYFGGAGGATAGYQLGSGIGQQNYQTSHPYTPYNYSYPSTRKSNFGGGSQ